MEPAILVETSDGRGGARYAVKFDRLNGDEKARQERGVLKATTLPQHIARAFTEGRIRLEDVATFLNEPARGLMLMSDLELLEHATLDAAVDWKLIGPECARRLRLRVLKPADDGTGERG